MLLVAATTVLALWPNVYLDYPRLSPLGPAPPDEGTILHWAKRSLTEVGHRDFFDFKGFGGLLPIVIAFAVDRPGVVSARVGVIIALGVISALCYAAVKLGTRRRTAGILAAASAGLLSFPNWPFAYQQHSFPIWSIGAVVVALLAQGRAPRLLVIAGALAAVGWWTDLTQAVPSTVGLALAIAFAWGLSGRTVWKAVGAFALGFTALQACCVGYYAARGALRSLVDDMVVYPLVHYPKGNAIPFGNGREWWIGNVAAQPGFMPEAGRFICDGALVVVALGCALAVVAGGALVILLVRARLFKRPATPELAAWIGGIALAASNGAAAVPILLGVSRGDLAHVGFMVPCSAVSFFAVLLGTPRNRIPYADCARGVTVLVSSCVVTFAAYFHVHAFLAMPKGARVGDLDRAIRSNCQVKFVEMASDPKESVVVLPGAGFNLLYADRRSAIPFTALFYETETSPPEQWARAASSIAKERPPFLLADEFQFIKLVQTLPAIATTYYGEDGLYLRHTSNAKNVELGKRWSYRVTSPKGDLLLTGAMEILESAPGSPLQTHMFAYGATVPVQGRFSRGTLILLPPGQKVVARLSADGRTLRGIAGNRGDCRYVMPLESPSGTMGFEATRENAP